jgi:hypothetical protein
MLSDNEIKNVALKHPENKTYLQNEQFNVYTRVEHGEEVKIQLLNQESNAVIKEVKFKCDIKISDVGISTVTFTPNEDIIVINSDISSNPFVYTFSEDFLGYKTGSFYRLFADVHKYGYFATADGTDIVKEIKILEDLKKQKLEDRKTLRDKIKSERKAAFDNKKAEEAKKQEKNKTAKKINKNN